MTQVQYTFVFDKADEKKFRSVLERLDPDEYTIVEPIADFDNPDKKQWDPACVRTVMVMDPEAASTFRFSLKKLSIRRFRTEEEEAEEKRLRDENTIRINVRVPQNPANGSVPGV